MSVVTIFVGYIEEARPGMVKESLPDERGSECPL
jgi:hypothetical protein